MMWKMTGTAFALSRMRGRAMSKVILFPKRRSQNVERMHQKQSKHILFTLSVLSLVLVAVFSNEQYNRARNPIIIVSDQKTGLQQLDRAIASAQPMDPFRDYEWEQKLAAKLADHKTEIKDRTPASISTKSQKIELLRFGPLAGSYRLGLSSFEDKNLISEIEFFEQSEASLQAVTLDPAQFLQENKDLFSVSYDHFKRIEDGKFVLMNAKGEVTNTAEFTFGPEGEFLKLNFKK